MYPNGIMEGFKHLNNTCVFLMFALFTAEFLNTEFSVQ